MIDLRSDTVTRPTPAMREAMASAEVGDDVYSEDPTINKLEKEAAEVFGREASIFVPTGTMGNQIAIRLHTQHGQEVICEARSHVLDWEMAHLGDPLEDLAWSMDPLWSRPGDGRLSGMAPMADALGIWERASGLAIDDASFAWWRLFASVKGQAIWISSAKAWKEGGFAEPILAFSGWYTARRQDEILAQRLATMEL